MVHINCSTAPQLGPVLVAVWLETLHVSSTGSSVRCVKQDTRVGGRLLRRGHRIIIPFRLLHLDEAVYSSDAARFKPERYLAASADPKKDDSGGVGDAARALRARGGNWRPFGGGKTICTGRFVAEHMIKSCVAMILHRFDLSVLDGAPIPQGDECTPGLGIMGLRKGEDFKVRITAKKMGSKV